MWITSILSILGTFLASYFLLSPLGHGYWLALAIIISCGTLGAALIPEFTKFFTSPTSKHVKEVVKASLTEMVYEKVVEKPIEANMQMSML